VREAAPASGSLRFAAPRDTAMSNASLAGRSILVVEDEPLIVMDITQAFEHTGAEVTSTNTLRHALLLAEHDGLSAAILDHALGDGDSSELCARLKERGIPFMIYSGYVTLEGACKGAPQVNKPARDGELVAAMENLLGGKTSKSLISQGVKPQCVRRPALECL